MSSLSCIRAAVCYIGFELKVCCLISAAIAACSLASAGVSIQFSDIAQKAGINFVHHNGATGKRLLPEAMGSGCAFIDLDGDGWPDILLINNRDWAPSGKHYFPALYHNNRNGTFTDITGGSGLDVEIYGMGVAVADYDNDGLPDVYITALEGDRLFHNDGHGHFRDVTAASGIHNANFGTSAAWFDFDRDGKADLIVANYVQWTLQTDVRCSLDGKSRSYCTPEAYKGESLRLYRNLGGGKFQDVTQKAGLADATSKSLGIVVFDYNGDHWPDLFIANDTQPNKLYRNNKNGTFTEEGLQAGVAYGDDGKARGAMGADASDYDRSGKPHLLVGNFSKQMLALYHNDGSGLFADTAAPSVVGQTSLLSLTWAAFFLDYDLDGYLDIFAANGHLDPDINHTQSDVFFKQPPLLFRNTGKGTFQNMSGDSGPDFKRPLVARGAAFADFDHDGDPDILISTSNGPAVLLRNDGGNKNSWLNVTLIGTKSNRSGLDSVVRVESASGKQWQTVHSGSSYCSASDLALIFGLKQDSVVTRLTVEWPSGKVQELTNIPANQFIKIDETKGLVR
jgi:hypothetical protein